MRSHVPAPSNVFPVRATPEPTPAFVGARLILWKRLDCGYQSKIIFRQIDADRPRKLSGLAKRTHSVFQRWTHGIIVVEENRAFASLHPSSPCG